MAKPNFGFQKRQREQAKERKKQEKAARKAERAAEQGPDALMDQAATADGGQADDPASGDQQA
ncbi:MAG: hypothetical protein P3A28_05905 [Gemmatimonadota bacterium]|nr:hypothetical protein [Gemmatimonadota bacterium]